jgi:hypothetical protein
MGFVGFFFFSLCMLTVCTLAKYYSRNSRSVSCESKFVKTLSFTLCLHQIGYMQNTWFESEILGYFFRYVSALVE